MSGPEYRLETEQGLVIAPHVRVADSILSRARGLMLRGDLPAGHGLVLRPCNSIHMFFMRFPLDVLFVDADGRVLRALQGIAPWRVSGFVRRAAAAIELRAGTLESAGVTEGTTVRMVSTRSAASS